MMRFVREGLIQSLVVIGVMYLVQIIKYWAVENRQRSFCFIIICCCNAHGHAAAA